MKPSPLDHLPRRSLFADADVNNSVHVVNTNPSAVNANPKPVPEPRIVTLDSPKPVKLAAAVAAPHRDWSGGSIYERDGIRLLLTSPAPRSRRSAPSVEPAPLVDTTQRGPGRPKMHVDRAAYRREWMARKRAERASKVGGKSRGRV
jgi:hypothetical protein